MVQSNNAFSNEIIKGSYLEDDFDLLEFFNTLKRNKKTILKTLFISGLIGLIYGISQKRIWEGNFQIVLSKNNQSNPLSSLQNILPNGILNSIDLSNKGNSLATEVEILKSPSVLMSVFEYVKSENLKNNQEWKFTDWSKQNLKIKLEKGTSILNLSYRDRKKDIILPVLNQISKKYQDYSGRERERSLEQGVKYLSQQVEIYKEKSRISQKNAQLFAINQDLTPLNRKEKGDDEIVNIINVEEIRVKAANEIRNINQQLKLLENFDNSSDQIIYFANQISDGFMPQLEELNKINSELQLKSISFLESDKELKLLKSKKRKLKDNLKLQIDSFLKGRRNYLISQQKSAERPSGVLIKYKELLKEALRDEKTLSRLEIEKSLLSLEKARNQRPWELITNPTLEIDPIGPSRKLTLGMSLFFGFLISLCFIFYKETKSNKIYGNKYIKNTFFAEDFFTLKKVNDDKDKDEISLIKTKILTYKDPFPLDIFYMGNIDKNLLSVFEKELISNIPIEINSQVINNLSEIRIDSKLILLINYEDSKKDNLLRLKRKLLIDNKSLIALVFVNN